jgi:hypothetical protein
MTLLIATCTVASGQQPAPVAGTQKSAFHWKASEAKELGSEDRIKVSKSLDPAERSALIEAIAALLRPRMADLDIHTENELHSIVADTRIKFIDLNDDGIPEVIAQVWGVRAGCGATGNCPFWVFSKSDSGYKLILGKDGWVFQIFTVEPTVTNGFHDLVLGMHDSASEKTLYIYQFKNGRYRRGACYDADWAPMNAKGWHELKNPLITPCKR